MEMLLKHGNIVVMCFLLDWKVDVHGNVELITGLVGVWDESYRALPYKDLFPLVYNYI